MTNDLFEAIEPMVLALARLLGCDFAVHIHGGLNNRNDLTPVKVARADETCADVHDGRRVDTVSFSSVVLGSLARPTAALGYFRAAAAVLDLDADDDGRNGRGFPRGPGKKGSDFRKALAARNAKVTCGERDAMTFACTDDVTEALALLEEIRSIWRGFRGLDKDGNERSRTEVSEAVADRLAKKAAAEAEREAEKAAGIRTLSGKVSSETMAAFAEYCKANEVDAKDSSQRGEVLTAALALLFGAVAETVETKAA